MSRPRQEGGGDGRARRCGDVEEGAARGAAGGTTKSRSGDAGEIDAQREAGLFKSLLWHSEGLQLLLAVGHVRVLAAPADAVQTCLQTNVSAVNHDTSFD